MKKNITFLTIVYLFIAPVYAMNVHFPIPKFFKLHIVADEMNYNSVTMSISGFDTNKSATDILEFYTKEWDGEIKTSHYGEWIIYSHLKEGILYTVQFKENKLSITGFIALSNLPGVQSKKLKRLGDGFPMPKNTKVANDIRTNEAGRMSRMLLLTNSQSVNSNYEYYRRILSMQGWEIQYEEKFSKNRAGLVLAKNNSTLNVVILKDNKKSNIQAIRIDN